MDWGWGSSCSLKIIVKRVITSSPAPTICIKRCSFDFWWFTHIITGTCAASIDQGKKFSNLFICSGPSDETSSTSTNMEGRELLLSLVCPANVEEI